MRRARSRKTFHVKFEKKLYKTRIHVILIKRRFIGALSAVSGGA
jgi:hypothetical protein